MSKKTLDKMIEKLVNRWPEHHRFINKAQSQHNNPSLAYDLAETIFQIANADIDCLISGYQWMCGMMLEEELYFRRHGTYRHTSFSAVNQLIYQNTDSMTKYMDGLLFSQALWPNHVNLFDFYLNKYLVLVSNSTRHLEVGSGHGLLLYYASKKLSGLLEGWDVSASVLQKTKTYLQRFNNNNRIKLVCRDITAPHTDDLKSFDSIVISEVLEHLEQPSVALESLNQLALPGAKIFINVPVNSPAIDHIYHFKTPEEVVTLVENIGFKVEHVCIQPTAGMTELCSTKSKNNYILWNNRIFPIRSVFVKYIFLSDKNHANKEKNTVIKNLYKELIQILCLIVVLF